MFLMHSSCLSILATCYPFKTWAFRINLHWSSNLLVYLGVHFGLDFSIVAQSLGYGIDLNLVSIFYFGFHSKRSKVSSSNNGCIYWHNFVSLGPFEYYSHSSQNPCSPHIAQFHGFHYHIPNTNLLFVAPHLSMLDLESIS